MSEDSQKEAPTLLRERAEALVQAAVVKAKWVNASPQEFPFAVKTLVVFGSFLTDKPVLGDLDLALEVELVRPLEFFGKYARPIHWSNKTYKALRLRKPKLVNVHWLGEVIEMKAPYRVLFEKGPDS